MTKTEFQAEAVGSRARLLTALAEPKHGRSAVTADNLMLALQLRSWLTDAEHQFIDDLAPAGAMSFIIRDGFYLHPEDVPLFDAEQLGGVISQAADAIFTQRYEHMTGDRKGVYHIHWANLSPVSETSLIFGLFGPVDRMASPNAINRFYRLVADLRHAWERAADAVTYVSHAVCDNGAGMVVDRDSGTILCCNDSMAEICRSSMRDLVGRNIHDIRLETETGRPNALKMEHVDRSTHHLCLIQTGQTLAVDDDDDPYLAAQFVHAIRNKLTGIQAAADQLKYDFPDADPTMVDLVIESGQALATQIGRFDLLLTYGNRTNQSIDVLGDLQAALHVLPADISIEASLPAESIAKVRAPSGAWCTLFGAVCERHLGSMIPGSPITLTATETSREIVIRMTSTQASAVRVKPFLGQFISRLASLLKATVTMTVDDATLNGTTEIRCPRAD